MSSQYSALIDSLASRRQFSFAFGALILMLLVFPFGATKADDAVNARNFIETHAEHTLQTLTVKGISRTERVARFRKLLTRNFDIETIGRWVLGRYWRRANIAQQKQYLKHFENLIVGTYADRFERYAGEKLVIVKALSQSDKDVVVYTKIARPTSEALLMVDWRVRRRGGNFAIVDVIVEGVSMGQTQRSEFASSIRRDGGLDGFIAELKKRVDSQS
jgi:phospholipid transport system substrate-binding protein